MSVGADIKLQSFVSEMNRDRVGIAVGLLAAEVTVTNRAGTSPFLLIFFLKSPVHSVLVTVNDMPPLEYRRILILFGTISYSSSSLRRVRVNTAGPVSRFFVSSRYNFTGYIDE